MIKHASKFFAAVAALCLTFAGIAQADGHPGDWTLDGASSMVAFGSIKKDKIGEVHSFTGLSGTVSKDGKVTVDIDVATLETNIDIRNERMLRFVLDAAPKATLTATIDMAELNSLKPGDTTDMDVEGKLNVNGADVDVEAEMFVARLTDKKAMVTTNGMIMVPTADLGIDEGVDKLMQLAKLPGITRVTPVTLRLVFMQK